MFRYGTMLPALALAGVLALVSAPEARAQTADDLDCKKCVGTGDIAKKAVTGNRLKNKAVTRRKIRNGAVSQSKLGFDVATQEELDAVSLDQGALLNHLLPKTAFVTSDDFTGNLGGLAGADAICQAAANDPLAVVPAGDYVAWLSTDTVDARDRITQTLGPYVRSDGQVIAKSYADLINTDNTNLLSGITGDEFGNQVESVVWTATAPTGLREVTFNSNCAGWTNGTASVQGPVGASDAIGTNWTEFGVNIDCNTTLPLYGFQK